MGSQRKVGQRMSPKPAITDRHRFIAGKNQPRLNLALGLSLVRSIELHQSHQGLVRIPLLASVQATPGEVMGDSKLLITYY